jgi:hypothetical protein
MRSPRCGDLEPHPPFTPADSGHGTSVKSVFYFLSGFPRMDSGVRI